MAISETVPVTQGPELAKQIGSLFSGLYHRLRDQSGTPVLSESFEIWNLSTRYLKRAIEKGKFPTHKTKFQHHQIMLNKRARAHAVSRELPDGKQQVFSVQISRIAERIDDAITHIDNTDETNSKVRLLISRSFSLYAFWFFEREQIYIISIPGRFKELEIGQYLSPNELIRVLQDKLEHLKRRRDYRHRPRQRHL